MSSGAEVRNVIIIGSGPSGYTAAVYLARARLAPLLFSGQEIGGQLMYTTDVENFPGFPKGVAGPLLMSEMRSQASKFGTEIIDKRVDSVKKVDGIFEVTVGADTYQAKAILIATGAKSRMLGVDGEDELLGRGLSTCAVCDAAFFRERQVYVVGGGDAAMEDALALARFTDTVTILHRRDEFRASKIMQERALEHENITVRWNSEVVGIAGENGLLKSIEVADTKTGEKETLPADGLFLAIGHVPSTKFLDGFIQLNEEGYIVTRMGMDRASLELAQANVAPEGRVQFLTMTSEEGVFAAGDCVDFMYRQAVTAAAFGTMAALDVEHWLERQ
jgi:thioredoxin reductase (NADPH)